MALVKIINVELAGTGRENGVQKTRLKVTVEARRSRHEIFLFDDEEPDVATLRKKLREIGAIGTPPQKFLNIIGQEIDL